MMELVDISDLGSDDETLVGVQIPLSVSEKGSCILQPKY